MWPWTVPGLEKIRWLPRRASTLALPGIDFWLIDDQVARWNVFSGDGQVLEPTAPKTPARSNCAPKCSGRCGGLAAPHTDYRTAPHRTGSDRQRETPRLPPPHVQSWADRCGGGRPRGRARILLLQWHRPGCRRRNVPTLP
ncbi:DUF6879 family protein [Streptomyces sp. Wh19]|uniref:DUF6879 family protein n=1 Tax=Streptomyces sanglieri TaxID=193460 RepID=A0ABW2X794_9ACTN